jgi:arabinosyltransferase
MKLPRPLPIFVVLVLVASLLGLISLQGAELTLSASTLSAPSADHTELVARLRAQLQQAEQRSTTAEAELRRLSVVAAEASAMLPAAESAAPAAFAAAASASAASASAASASAASASTASASAAIRQYVHTIESIPAKPGELMMMTYATGGVREMLHNWVLHVQRLGLPVLVAAMDKAVVSMAVEKHFDCLDWSHTATGADRQYVRGSFDGFRALGVRKIDALLPVLRAGVHVVLSDVDCVWSSSPLPMFHGQISGFEDFAHADLLVATDCMDPEDDHRNHGCYHDTVDKNTGVLAVRATPNGIAAMAEWRIRLAVGQKDEQDQTTFNDLLDGNGRGHRWGMDGWQRSEFMKFATEWCRRGPKVSRGFNRLWEGDAEATSAKRHTPGSRRVYDVCLPNSTRHARVGVFPIADVAGGHTFFVQQLHTLTGKWPMAVHATYQFGDQQDYPFGKRQRFRDWGMWLADDDDELVTGSRYLVLEDDAPLEPRKAWVGEADYHVRAARGGILSACLGVPLSVSECLPHQGHTLETALKPQMISDDP